LALAVGNSLRFEVLPDDRWVWVPLSVALVAGIAATLRLALRRLPGSAPPVRLWRSAALLLAAGLVSLLVLRIAFVRSVEGGNRDVKPAERVLIVKGWSGDRTAQEGMDQCTPEYLDICWPERPLIFVAIGLSYLAALSGIGALAGLSLGCATASSGSPPSRYLDFDLKIEPLSAGRYRASAWTSEQFEASAEFGLPSLLSDLRAGPLRFAGLGATRGGVATTGQNPEEVGGELFNAVFQDEVLAGFRVGLANREGGPGVRLRLRLDRVPELANLPWEYLFDRQLLGFLACSTQTPVVRYLELPEAVRPVAVEPPLRILVMVSTPADYNDLEQADREWRGLCAALQPLVHQGKVEIERIAPRIDALQRRLRTGRPVHAFHFVGHGGFDATAGQGVLVLEDESGKGRPVKSGAFASLLKNGRTLRLAVLNACNGASSRGDDAFAGTAQSLVERGGVPAVVAMRSEISDDTARRFAECFYRALADLLPIDACIGEARTALAAEDNLEWGTPVLYLRAADGQLFAPAGDPTEA
jgi:hypothetical protein